MQKGKQLVPKLRFPGFEGEWDKMKIKDALEFKNGKGHEQYIDKNGVYIVVNSKFVSTNGKVKKFTNQIICPLFKNNIAMVMSDIPNGKALAKCYLVKENDKFSLNQRICSLYSKKHSNKFLFYRINRHKYFLKFDTGYSQTNLRKDEIINAPLIIPSLPEQQKIANFLSAIDIRIHSLARKKQDLERYKKGVMQKIFKQEIRFKDDDGKEFPAWEKKKLGVLTYKVGKKNKENIQYPIYSINNQEGFRPQSEQFDGLDSNDRGYDISLYKIVNEKTFAYNPARINVGSIGYSYDLNKVIISSLYVCFKTKEELEDLYLLAYLDTDRFNKDILRYEEGGVRQYLFYENFSQIKIPLPSNEEQTKIANFLSAIDKKIDLTHQQIEHTKTYKKGLLQQMFV